MTTTTTPTTPKAPPGLGPRARRLWADLHAKWDYRPDELEVLRLAVEAVDRACRAQALLDKEGLMLEGRYGPKENLACAVRTAAETSAARLLRQLGFDRDVQAAGAARKGGVALAQKRWRGANNAY